MSFRNLSPQQMFENLSKEHTPEATFKGKTEEEFTQWKKSTLPRVLATLGDFPENVDPDPMLLAEWRQGGLKKQKWLINVQKHISATFLINIPGDLAPGEKRAAILCWHGHGIYGKEPVMGNDSSPEMRDSIIRMNYNYGQVMAESGFVTFAIDWIGMGDRNDNRKPNFKNQNAQRDWCNLYYLHATMMGMTSISINVRHGMAATEFAMSFPFIDPKNLGVMGLSGGGTMTLWTALCDSRFKAAEIICYSGIWPYFGFRDINYCGMQVAPGLFKLVHLHDLQGLLAPRPLLIDIGVYDTCFYVDEAHRCFTGLQKIYQAADCEESLELDLFPGEHSWGGNKSLSFFKRHLGKS